MTAPTSVLEFPNDISLVQAWLHHSSWKYLLEVKMEERRTQVRAVGASQNHSQHVLTFAAQHGTAQHCTGYNNRGGRTTPNAIVIIILYVLQSSIKTVAPGFATGSNACKSLSTPDGVCSPSMLSKSQRWSGFSFKNCGNVSCESPHSTCLIHICMHAQSCAANAVVMEWRGWCGEVPAAVCALRMRARPVGRRE